MKKQLKQRLAITAVLLALALMVSVAASGLLTQTKLDAYTGVRVVLDGQTVEYTYDNGTKTAPFLVDGVTYLPVRAISEALGLDVEWDAATATVTLSSDKALFADLTGTYDELFTVICDPKYDQIWLDSCAAIVGAENAPMYAQMLKSACTGTITVTRRSRPTATAPTAHSSTAILSTVSASSPLTAIPSAARTKPAGPCSATNTRTPAPSPWAG